MSPYAASRHQYRGRPIGPRHLEYPPKTSNALTRELFMALHEQGCTMQAISERTGYDIATLRRWRNDQCRPRLIDLESIGGQFGLQLTVEVLPMAALLPGRETGHLSCRAASPVMRQLFQLMSDWRIELAAVAKAVGRSARTFPSWAAGRSSPGIGDMETLAHALGCRLLWSIQEFDRDAGFAQHGIRRGE